MRVLVTRPTSDAKATADRLVALGHDVLLAPLMRIVADPAVALPLDGVAALLVTSRNAAEALAARPDRDALAARPVFAVGDRTAATLRRAGFADVLSADGDRHALRALVAATLAPTDGTLLWAAGADRTGDLVAEFAECGFRTVIAEVYRAEAVDHLPAAVEAALAAGTVDAVAVYSPRSARILVERLAALGGPAASPRLCIHAISEAALQPFRAAGWGNLVAAARPKEDALMETFRRPRPLEATAAPDDPGRPSMPSKIVKGEPAAETEAPVVPPVGDETAAPASPPEPTAATTDEPAAAPADTADAPAAAAPLDTPTAEPIEAPAEPAPVVASEPPTAAPTPVAPPPAAPSAGRLIAAVVVATLLGGGLGVAGSHYLARTLAPPPAPPVAPGPTAAETKALADRLAALETKLGTAADLAGRLAAVESGLGAQKPADLSGLDARLAAIEAAPALKLPADLDARLAAIEKSAGERLEAARTAVGDALAKLPDDAGAKAALTDLAGRLDAALAAAREASAAEIARLAAELDAQKAELKAKAAAAGDGLKATLDDTATRLAAEVEKRQAEIAATVDGLRQRLAGIEGLRAEVDGVVGRLGGLETSNKEAKADRGRMVETLDATKSLAEGRVGTVEQKLATLEAGAADARRAQAEAVFAVALADLKSAVDAGRPFAPELDVVRRSTPEGTTLALAPLDPFVATGVPSVGALRDGLPRIVRAMHEAEEVAGTDAGPLDRMWAHAGRLVRVRPAGEAAGTDVGAMISRVEGRMVAGDLAAALAAWKALPEPSRKASATWAAALEARVAVDAALAAQTAAVVSKLSQPRP